VVTLAFFAAAAPGQPRASSNEVLFTLDLPSGRFTPLAGRQGAYQGRPRWHRNGQFLVAGVDYGQGTAIWRFGAEARSEERLVAERLHPREFDLAPDGTLVFAAGEKQRDLFTLAPGDRSPRRLTSGKHDEWGLSWSQDGKGIAFIRDEDAGKRSVVVMDADIRNCRVFSLPFAWEAPAWSPDGRHLALTAANELLLVSTADGATRRLAPAAFVAQAQWSPDGRQILFTSGRLFDGPVLSGTRDVYRVDLAGAVRALTRDRMSNDAVWSPDGKQIAYVSDRDLQLVNVDGTGARNVTIQTQVRSGVRWPSWSPDGRRIAFVAEQPPGSFGR
jgi:Tol biopolymer transport system component